MLSKCANPRCGARFHYLNIGRLFVLRSRKSRASDQPSSDAEGEFEPIRYFWLCAACSQTLTIQASGSGRMRIAPKQMSAGASGGDPAPIDTGSTDCEVEFHMPSTKTKLDALKKELEFLENGGYRMAIGWRPPLVFEDSPICPKPPYAECPDSSCILIDFVPDAYRQETIPCRYIPLNNAGETVHSLYSTAKQEEIEDRLRQWLKTEITKLEREASNLKQKNSDAA